jgi:hypothetical protein
MLSEMEESEFHGPLERQFEGVAETIQAQLQAPCRLLLGADHVPGQLAAWK